ncbi:MAG: bifunctional precorrin-2 dehydrogenase/sirohydrochlorin ferrochelatase [Caldilineaceae bacterium]|nr:bifunctional precorrin-2 dehydrogenase/sirohydrochlorin ferrochelatase [Caldilineaceae bacterium]
MKTYPVNLVLEDRLVVLVGAKGEIVHKLDGLLEAGARVRVIAPSAQPEVEQLAAAGRIEWWRRPYRFGDLAGASVVFAATRDAEVHDLIWTEGVANGQLVNIMDVPDQCNFYGASFLRRGLLTIAIGTGGAAPALAVTLRKRFEREFGDEYAAFLDLAAALRPAVAQQIPSFRQRVVFWYALVESDLLALLAAGRTASAQAYAERLLAAHAAGEAGRAGQPLAAAAD